MSLTFLSMYTRPFVGWHLHPSRVSPKAKLSKSRQWPRLSRRDNLLMWMDHRHLHLNQKFRDVAALSRHLPLGSNFAGPILMLTANLPMHGSHKGAQPMKSESISNISAPQTWRVARGRLDTTTSKSNALASLLLDLRKQTLNLDTA